MVYGKPYLIPYKVSKVHIYYLDSHCNKGKGLGTWILFYVQLVFSIKRRMMMRSPYYNLPHLPSFYTVYYSLRWGSQSYIENSALNLHDTREPALFQNCDMSFLYWGVKATEVRRQLDSSQLGVNFRDKSL